MKLNYFLWTMVLFTFCLFELTGQKPIIKVDFNIADRQESEVNEPGYKPWPVINSADDSMIIDGVKIKLTGTYGSSWYKAGVNSPYFARLANDGLQTGGGVELIISDLPSGEHTLLTFHNTFSNYEGYTLSPIDIYLNSELKYNDLVQTNRVTSNLDAQSAYLKFNIIEGEDVKIKFRPDTSTSATVVIAALCGFELNTPNAKSQALFPYPFDGDKHVNADSGNLTLKWEASPKAISHDVYFGNDYSEIENADTSSFCFIGNKTDTFLSVSNLYSMQGYYWRIDEHDSLDTVTTGDIWYFKPRQTAFPGAEGYGRYAIGGRGGKVVKVTSLDDSGPGSLREAVTNNIGPRTIIFDVSGIITLKSRLAINQDYITIAGQTAPGKGICIRQAAFGASGADDVIIRHMRVRVGSGPTWDGMGLAGSNHCIIDHCSISWTSDEAVSSRNGINITLQKTMISEPLNVPNRSGIAHGYAGSIGGDIGSFHHNLLAHCAGRNWSMAGGLDGNGYFAGRLDIFNNVVYNWNSRTNDGGAHEVNFVNNYYKIGPAWKTNIDFAMNAQYENFPGTQQYYVSGNVMPGVFDESNQEDGKIYTGTPQGYSPWVDKPFFSSWAKIHTAWEAYQKILSDVGATQPVFDDHDKRIIIETIDSSYTYIGSYTSLKGIPDEHADVGGWEDYPTYRRSHNWDSDMDGMPNWWEECNGLNPNSTVGDFSESNDDPDKDGYTNLEDYLNWMAEPHYFLDSDSSLEIDLLDLSMGFNKNPVYTIDTVINGNVDQTENLSEIEFTPAKEGLASFTFTVTDNWGYSMQRKIGIYIGSLPEDSAFVYLTDGISESNQSKNKILYYPNPVKEVLHIKLTENIKPLQWISVINSQGEKVKDIQISGYSSHDLISIDTADLKTGIYFVMIGSNLENKVLKFVKQ